MRAFFFAPLFFCVVAAANDNAKKAALTLSVCTELSKHADVTKVITGSTTDQIIRAGNQSGIHFNVQYRAWNRCLQMAQDNRVDGIYALFWTPERARFLAFPQGSESSANITRLRTAQFFFYENINKPLDVDNLEFGIGAPLGYVVRDYLEEQGWLSPIDYSIKEGFTMLGMNKLDAYLIAEEMGDNMVMTLQQHNIIRKKQPAFIEQDIHIAFTKDIYQRHAEQIDLFWEAVESIRGNYQ